MDLLKLRPADNTSGAIRTALTDAEQALATNQAEQANAKSQRDAALLEASPAEFAKLEKALSTTREMGERIAAVVDQLRARLADALRSEVLVQVEAARIAAERAQESLSAWWRKEGSKLFATMRAGVALQDAAENTAGDWRRAALSAQQQGHGGNFQPPVSAPGPDGWLFTVEMAARMRDFTDPFAPPPPVAPAPPPARPDRPNQTATHMRTFNRA